MALKFIALKRVSLALILLFGLTACSALRKRSLRFDDAHHGAPLFETEYTFSLASERQQLPSGTWLTHDTLSLVHSETGEHFLVSTGRFLDESPNGLTCQDCVRSLKTDDERIYLLTRFNGGGSGGFYFHNLVELTDKGAVTRGGYDSCGQVLYNLGQLTFPSHEYKCPELFFTPETSGARTVEKVSLN